MSTNLINDLFGDGGVKVKPISAPADSVTFRPKASKGQNGIYSAVIRFVPNPENPRELSIVSKTTCYMTNPITKQSRTIDCPSTVGEPDPIKEMFFAIHNAKNLPENLQKDYKKNFSEHTEYRSIIQVIECENEPQLNGKLLVWKYGKKIFEKIQQEQTPVVQGAQPGQPFDLFMGRLFKVIAKKQGEGFDDISQSMFFDLTYPSNCIRVPVTTANNLGQPVTTYKPASRDMASTPEGQQLIADFLTKNAPKLSVYEYKPWDEETRKFVEENIVLYSQLLDGKPINMPQQNAAVNAMIQGAQAIPMTAQTTPLNGGMAIQQPSNLGAILAQAQPQQPMTVPTPAATAIPQTPVTPTPSTTPSAAMPQLGANLSGMGIPTPTSAVAGVSGVDAANIEQIMNGIGVQPSADAQSAPAQTSAPNNISDILQVAGM